jgi:signal transduction histidine kinase
VTGARLWVLGDQGLLPDALSACLDASGRRVAVLSPEAAQARPPGELPEVAVIPVSGEGAGVAALLAAWTDVPCHAVFLAQGGQPPIPGPVMLGRIDPAGLVAVLDVLAERERAVREAAGQAAWSETLLGAFPGGVVAVDEGGRVVFANERVRERIGRDPAGGRCFEILHGRDVRCPWCQRDKVLAGETVALEVQSPLDGLYFETVSMPLRLPQRPPLDLTFFIDVTERNLALGRLKSLGRDLEARVVKRTELLARQTEALSEANARLIELDALKSGFLATVTHDLRTPLTSVLGFAKLTRRDFVKEFMPFSDVSQRLAKKGARIAENLRIIENEGARLTRLVNDFLDLSKIESGRLDWHDRLVAPDEVVRMAVDAVTGEYEQNEQLVLVVEVCAALPPLRVDPDRLMQVLVNLLTNAARYAREGEVVLSVGRLASGRVEFRVADAGPGVPEEERERIFDKFHQVRRGDTTAGEQRGTGLGLAICKHIVERYNGEIRVESRQPRGTVFVVELPVYRESSPPDAGSTDSPSLPETSMS